MRWANFVSLSNNQNAMGGAVSLRPLLSASGILKTYFQIAEPGVTMTVVLSGQGLTKAYHSRPLFQNISLGIDDNARIGLIGPNGSGKSTLLKILAGLKTPDSGAVSLRRNVRLVYVRQEESFPTGATVQDVLMQSIAPEPLDDAEREVRIAVTLARAGFEDTAQWAETLSGGWKKRLAIAAALAQEPDLLMLDEPTNHLDLEGVLWLEDLLRGAAFAYVVVTHDRYFLEHVTSRMIELNPIYAEGYLSVEGKYSDFVQRRADYLSAQATQEATLVTQVKREVAWLQRGPQARTTKAQSRIQGAERMIEELGEVKFRNAQTKSAGIEFQSSGRQTRELLVAKEIEKSLGGRALFSHIDLTMRPGLRLGLLGPNGSGKTTLLRLFTGELEPDRGTIKRADGLRIVFFDQNRARLDKTQTLRDALSANGETITYRNSTMHVSAWAKRFLFSAEQLNMPLSRFSGGEQARVLIAQLMLEPADLLILDEPTNDLDIPALEVLEESLTGFPGALVLVTHDRYLLDRVSTEILALDAQGHADFYADFAQWEMHQKARFAPPATRVKASAPPPAPRAASRLSSSERKELVQMEAKIEEAEQAVGLLERQLEDPRVASDSLRLQECWNALPVAKEQVIALYARWEELEEKR